MFKDKIKRTTQAKERCRRQARTSDEGQHKYWLTRTSLYNDALKILISLQKRYKHQVPFWRRLLGRDESARIGFNLIQATHWQAIYEKYYPEGENQPYT